MSIRQRVSDKLIGEILIPMGAASRWRPVLQLGNNGADVAAWQSVLLGDDLDISDHTGIFGQSTHNATMSFQVERGLFTDGLVGPKTKAAIGGKKIPQKSPALPNITFIEARNWSRQVPPRDRVDWIVIHCMEAPETSTRAERCASRFADPMNAPKASCHYCVDCDSIVQCVADDRIAWHAPGANKYGIGIEHAGYARQNRMQWLDPFGIKMLTLSAELTADLCRRWDIPTSFVSANGLRQGRRGITTHAEVSEAFKKSTHWDPGQRFPIDWYIDRVRGV